MDSEILDQLTDLGRDVDSEFPKPKRGHKRGCTASCITHRF